MEYSFRWVCEGLVRIGHVDFMLFVPISLARKRFLVEYGFNLIVLCLSLLSAGTNTTVHESHPGALCRVNTFCIGRYFVLKILTWVRVLKIQSLISRVNLQ